MCNLYTLDHRTRRNWRQLFNVRPERDRTGNLDLPLEFYPGHSGVVVRRGEDGEREMVMMRWGFVLPQEGKAPKEVTNARADKVATSPFWRQSFEQRRCLVPVTSFCEWTDKPDPKTGKKRKVWFGVKDVEVFAFAGLWRQWRGNYKGELVEWETYAFLTTEANEVVRPVHAKAMPVVLTQEMFGQWIEGPSIGPATVTNLMENTTLVVIP